MLILYIILVSFSNILSDYVTLVSKFRSKNPKNFSYDEMTFQKSLDRNFEAYGNVTYPLKAIFDNKKQKLNPFCR